MLDLVGAEPLAGPAIGRTAIGMPLDPEAERRECVELGTHLLEVGAQLGERQVIAGRRAQAFQEGDIQARGAGVEGRNGVRSDSRTRDVRTWRRRGDHVATDRSRLEVERQVERRCRVRQRADADPIDTCSSQRPHGVQTHAARGFEPHRRGDEIAAAHGLGHESGPRLSTRMMSGPWTSARSSCSSESTSISIVVPDVAYGPAPTRPPARWGRARPGWRRPGARRGGCP